MENDELLRALKSLGLVAAIGLASVLPAAAAPVIVNGDFTSGLTGWTLLGGGGASLSAFDYGLPGAGNAGTLDSNGNTVGQAAAENLFGLSAGSLTAYTTPASGPITAGSVLYQDITSGNAGDQITLDALYRGREADYDLALVFLGDTFGLSTSQVVYLGSGLVNGYVPQALTLTLGRDASVANPLRFGFYVTNTFDTTYSSTAGIANVMGVDGTAGEPGAPELNASGLLPGSLFAGLMLGMLTSRRRPQAV